MTSKDALAFVKRYGVAIKGSVHAWIGIILRGLTTLLWDTLISLMVVGVVAGARSR